ncbi:GNAT family N-acetyltransferase [Micromonospora sp. NPDC050686]|uniref:GNAT family N-acetyltransferase n=1 Tax=Micromonospora sp. NPDC050686 TaxID=3154631 RepID=UPI0033EDE327
MTIDLGAVRAAVVRQAERPTEGIGDMARYLAAQVADGSHREVTGPLLPGSGASGVARHRGEVVATWGDPNVPEMLFSGTKAVVATLAGVAFDRGLLHPAAPVTATVDHPFLAGLGVEGITWAHLLQQTSGWTGELWGKPTEVDAQSRREGFEREGAPGTGWAYNDVRVNLLCLALTLLFRRPLPDVLRETVLDPLGASDTWSWHGYADSVVDLDGRAVPVVSGGAHWGGGLWISAADLALLGELYAGRGAWRGQRLLSAEWIDRAWAPCELNPDYGYLWWRNDAGRVQPGAPTGGRCARGNGGRHLLWVDPDRHLVIASHWGEEVAELIREVSAAVPAARGGSMSTVTDKRTITLRPGVPADGPAVVRLLDVATAWLVARGRTRQWGTELASTNPRRIAQADEWAGGDGLWLAELDGRPVGALVVGAATDYVPPATEPELYVNLLVTDRAHAGLGIGARLLAHAGELARERGVGLLRVDCYGGDDRALVRFYESCGFTATDPFIVERPGREPWPGQVLERRLD